MLGPDALKFQVQGGRVEPGWIALDGVLEEALAQQLISLAQDSIGHARGDYEEAQAELFAQQPDPRLAKGLAKVLERWLSFEEAAESGAEALRRKLFGRAAIARREGAFQRAELLAAVAAEEACSSDELLARLWADAPDRARLLAVDTVSPVSLLRRWQMGLLQGLVAHASELRLRFEAPDPASLRALIARARFLRLLFAVEACKGGFEMRLDGPAAGLATAARYGTRFASFVPALVHLGDWRLEADLKLPKRRALAKLKIDASAPLAAIGPLPGIRPSEELALLADRLEADAEGFAVDRQPALRSLGGQRLLLPDLVIRHVASGREAPLELLPDALERARERALTLGKHAPQPLLLVHREAAGKAKAGALQGEGDPHPVIAFKKALRLDRVLAALKGLLELA